MVISHHSKLEYQSRKFPLFVRTDVDVVSVINIFRDLSSVQCGNQNNLVIVPGTAAAMTTINSNVH
jgi:hypothetical protein